MSPEPTPLLVARGLTKTYPGARALTDVSFDIRPGEVHCFLGENGAGKSTLVKIMAGAVHPDTGEIDFDGEPLAGTSPAQRLRRGISVIYQELDLLPDLTVAQNMYLGHEPRRFGLVLRAERRRRAKEILTRLGCEFSPDAKVGSLSLAEQQMTAVARALTVRSKLIVMDEPSAALNERELEQLLRVIRELTAAGTAVVYISHRLPEIRAIGDRATVLRDGRHVTTVPLEDVSEGDLVRYMIGSAKPIGVRRERTAPSEAGVPVKLRINRAHAHGLIDVEGIDVYRGEVLGITGLVGSGRTTLLKALFGEGDVTLDAELDGERYTPGHARSAIARGVALVPEDRKHSGLVLDLSIAANTALPSYGKLSKNGYVGQRAVQRHAAGLIDQLGIRCAGPNQRVRQLSGGNQQKVVLGKWLGRGISLLLLDEPTRGLDIGAKSAVYDELAHLADDGLTTIVASSELGELLENCDRVLVMHEGRIVAERRASPEFRDEILTATITGAAS